MENGSEAATAMAHEVLGSHHPTSEQDAVDPFGPTPVLQPHMRPLALPPSPQEGDDGDGTAVVAAPAITLGSPLIAFSPLMHATASMAPSAPDKQFNPFDSPVAASTALEAQLLSFSPVMAATRDAEVDDTFNPAPTASVAAAAALGELLSFSPVAQTTPPPAPASEGVPALASDLFGLVDAPQSAPAALPEPPKVLPTGVVSMEDAASPVDSTVSDSGAASSNAASDATSIGDVAATTSSWATINAADASDDQASSQAPEEDHQHDVWTESTAVIEQAAVPESLPSSFSFMTSEGSPTVAPVEHSPVLLSAGASLDSIDNALSTDPDVYHQELAPQGEMMQSPIEQVEAAYQSYVNYDEYAEMEESPLHDETGSEVAACSSQSWESLHYQGEASPSAPEIGVEQNEGTHAVNQNNASTPEASSAFSFMSASVNVADATTTAEPWNEKVSSPTDHTHALADDFGDFVKSPVVTATSTQNGENAAFGAIDVAPSPKPTVQDEDDEFSDFAGPAQSPPAAVDEDDEFGAFGSVSAQPGTTAVTQDDDFNDFGMGTSTAHEGNDEFEAFDGFRSAPSSATATTTAAPTTATATADDFGNFATTQTSAASADDDFGDFGNNSNDEFDDDFGDFEQSTTATTGSSDNAFDTTASATTTSAAPFTAAPATVSIPAAANVRDLFVQAFPTAPLSSAPSLDISDSAEAKNAPRPLDLYRESNHRANSAFHEAFLASQEAYLAPIVTSSNNETSNADAASQPGKYLKYVLSEKIQEAARQEGVLSNSGGELEHLQAVAESGDQSLMHASLLRLQDALFRSSIDDAEMRIAKQAALSAKARIAEQAAQQQASGRGSLLATTRHLLSRSSDKDKENATLGVLTPTGASVHKISRFSFNQQQHETESNGHASNGSGDETGSDHSNTGDQSGHSGTSEHDFFPAPSSTGKSGGGGGGLMKKFQDRLTSFSSSRFRTRMVSLRRMGQSGQEIRKMELNMDTVSGGFDEVKWRCAVFLYDMEEVAQVAPSQIYIISYPGNQVLSCKTDRGALIKFLKPGTIWTIDIGAGNADVSNE